MFAAEIASKYDLNLDLVFNWKTKLASGADMMPIDITPDDSSLLRLVLPG